MLGKFQQEPKPVHCKTFQFVLYHIVRTIDNAFLIPTDPGYVRRSLNRRPLGTRYSHKKVSRCILTVCPWMANSMLLHCSVCHRPYSLLRQYSQGFGFSPRTFSEYWCWRYYRASIRAQNWLLKIAFGPHPELTM